MICGSGPYLMFVASAFHYAKIQEQIQLICEKTLVIFHMQRATPPTHRKIALKAKVRDNSMAFHL